MILADDDGNHIDDLEMPSHLKKQIEGFVAQDIAVIITTTKILGTEVVTAAREDRG